MPGMEQSLWAKALMLKIHVITGWVVPSGELQTVLVNQLGKHLIENYPDVNPDEVEFAFRKWGTTTKDWGKQMNLSLIDEVLLPYIILRGQVSELEANAKVPKTLPESTESLSDQAMADWLEETRRRKQSVEFMPPQLYEWIVEKQMVSLTTQKKHEYLQIAVAYRQSVLIKKHEEEMSKDNHAALVAFNRMKAEGVFTGPEIDILKTLAKKMILFNYLFDKV